MGHDYRICSRCVMDTSDPDIHFDEAGVCNHCHAYAARGAPVVAASRGAEGARRLQALIARIQADGRGREYDCIIGVSGGVDSSYVAYRARQFGLRPLAVHFDSGWNSELAVSNISNLVKRLDIDLDTHVADWEEMRDLQLAFFRASLANCDIPSDHAFLTVLYGAAARHGVRWILSGGNMATEFVLPRAWGYNAADVRHIKSVQARFGTRKLRRYPFLGFWKRYLYYPFLRQIRTVRVLDLLPYDKTEAMHTITTELGWRDYGGKHCESVFTRFFQAYYLPRKFGYDKRRAHLSSLILSGQTTREAALVELAAPPFDEATLQQDRAFVAKKLGLSLAVFEDILALPPRTYRDYPSNEWLFRLKDRVVRRLPALRVTA